MGDILANLALGFSVTFTPFNLFMDLQVLF